MIKLENKKGNILIVDPNMNTDFTLKSILKKQGYWVRFTHNFTKAMDILKKKVINIVLTEIEIPDRDGMKLLREIKKLSPAVQVLIMTDNGNIDSYLQAMELGAFEYFNKPIKNRVLCKAIEKALIGSN